MGIQKEILTRDMTTKVEVKGEEEKQELKAAVGTLALGKPGDIIATAYGPVTVATTLEAAIDFGKFLDGKGIVANSDDVAGVGTVNMFDTKTAKSGQTVSVLVSGGIIILCSEYNTIKAKMNIVGEIGEKTDGAKDVMGVIVNGLIPAPAAA